MEVSLAVAETVAMEQDGGGALGGSVTAVVFILLLRCVSMIKAQ